MDSYLEAGGSFDQYRYPDFQKCQEFALDGGVYFDTLTNSHTGHAKGVIITALKSSILFGLGHVSQIVTI